MYEDKFALRGLRKHEGVNIGQAHGAIDVIDSHNDRDRDTDKAHSNRFRIWIPSRMWQGWRGKARGDGAVHYIREVH